MSHDERPAVILIAGDKDVDLLRWNAELQVHVLSSPHIERDWIIDSTDLTLDEVYQQHFEPLTTR